MKIAELCLRLLFVPLILVSFILAMLAYSVVYGWRNGLEMAKLLWRYEE